MEDVENDHDEDTDDVNQQSHYEVTILLPIHRIDCIILEPYHQRINHRQYRRPSLNVDQNLDKFDHTSLRNLFIDGWEESDEGQ